MSRTMLRAVKFALQAVAVTSLIGTVAPANLTARNIVRDIHDPRERRTSRFQPASWSHRAPANSISYCVNSRAVGSDGEHLVD